MCGVGNAQRCPRARGKDAVFSAVVLGVLVENAKCSPQPSTTTVSPSPCTAPEAGTTPDHRPTTRRPGQSFSVASDAERVAVHQLEVAALAQADEVAARFTAAVRPEDDVVRCHVA